MTSKNRKLRQLLEADELLVAPGAYDAITAMVIEQAGFPAVYMTGAGTVNAHLGIPDIGLATMSEMVENAGRIAEAVSVPVICDADTGYGTALNVARTVRAFETAGASGVHIEDQVAPKRCGHLAGKQIISADEMRGKIQAATEVRRDDDFVVIARTDARAVEGLEASIERAGAYVEAGADVIFSEALESRDEFEAFASAQLGVPLMANMTEFGKTPYLSVDDFASLDYAAVIFPMLAFRVMLKAVDEAIRDLADNGTQRHILDRMRTREELYDLLGYADYDEASNRYAEDAVP